jgi:hypothetical protein
MYRLIRTGDEGAGTSATALVERVLRVWEALRAREERGELHLEEGSVQGGDATAIVQTALRHVGTYHDKAVITRRGDRVFSEDMKLLFYYSNRLRGYGLERELAQVLREVA